MILLISLALIASLAYSSTTGRVMETIESYPRMDDDLSSRVMIQLEDDIANDQFTPNISNDSLWIDNTIIGTIKLDKIIYTGRISLVATIVDQPTLLIKYQANCNRKKAVHPLIRDFWYSNDANSKGLAPEIVSLSPPSRLCESRIGKCGFDMTDDLYEACRIGNGTLRYMIMEKLGGESLHAFRTRVFAKTNGSMGLRNAAIIGGKLIHLLHRLHEQAFVVHGDIHSPNVMVQMDPITQNVELKFIDFGSAFRTPQDPLSEHPVVASGFFYHELFTIWQMLGYSWAPRDDLLKAIQTVAHIMHPFDYLDMEREVASMGGSMMRSWKERHNWFVTDSFDPVANLVGFSDEAKGEIYMTLDEILYTARNLKINEPIPFGKLKNLFRELVTLTSVVPTTTTTTTSTTTTITTTTTILNPDI